MSNLRLSELERQFRSQSQFADGYSALYASLFAIVAGWLAGGEGDPLVKWLLEASAGRAPLDVTLLLMAGLHREVLAGRGGDLASYYPTAIAAAPEVAARRTLAVTLPVALREAIMARRESLAEFIRTANVQTNETGRGLAWLLPVACLGWPAIHLVELGASAGLNLVADRRSYRIADAADPARTIVQLGGDPPQFTALARGAAEVPSVACCPSVRSRIGGDISPFALHSAADELTLASFVWGDQVWRMGKLREGIAALREAESSAAPVSVRPLRLPHELPRFLASELPQPIGAPVVIYNTVVTMYLPDRGASLRGMIAEWAAMQVVPVLWVQWEPWWDGPPPPDKEWQAWTADYWPNDGGPAGHRFHLAWVHPHGTAIEWAPGWAEFLRITMQS